MAMPNWLKQLFWHYDVPFEEHHHPPAHSALELAELEHVSGYRVAKTVYLSGHGHPIGVVLPACCRLDLARVQTVLEGPDLRLATEAEISGWFKGCAPGAVPPLYLRGDEHLIMDRSLAHLGSLLLPAGTLEDAVLVRFRDWYRAVRPGIGRFASPRPNSQPIRKPPAVMVVEDEPVTNDLLCRLLEREGFASHGVEAGNSALDMAPALKPDAILLDLMLPDISGFDVCERLRRVGPLKRIPVVMLSALDDAASRQRGQELGADAFLTKPFAPASLVAQLQEILDGDQ